jgi:hypothetical protein
MTAEQITLIRALREQGYAVTIFTPAEVGCADIQEVEDAMCEAGWHQIEYVMEAERRLCQPLGGHK